MARDSGLDYANTWMNVLNRVDLHAIREDLSALSQLHQIQGAITTEIAEALNRQEEVRRQEEASRETRKSCENLVLGLKTFLDDEVERPDGLDKYLWLLTWWVVYPWDFIVEQFDSLLDKSLGRETITRLRRAITELRCALPSSMQELAETLENHLEVVVRLADAMGAYQYYVGKFDELKAHRDAITKERHEKESALESFRRYAKTSLVIMCLLAVSSLFAVLLGLKIPAALGAIVILLWGTVLLKDWFGHGKRRALQKRLAVLEEGLEKTDHAFSLVAGYLREGTQARLQTLRGAENALAALCGNDTLAQASSAKLIEHIEGLRKDLDLRFASNAVEIMPFPSLAPSREQNS